jgi:integrase
MKSITILTPDQAETLLKCASGEIIPFFSIGLFAGLRVDEIQKLNRKHIDLVHKKIDLTWFPTKTLQPRWAPVSDNLVAILKPHAKTEGSVVQRSAQRLRKLRRIPTSGHGLRMRADTLTSVISCSLSRTSPKSLWRLDMTRKRWRSGTGDQF